MRTSAWWTMRSIIAGATTWLVAADRGTMLPPVTEISSWVRLQRDYYVRVASNDYSSSSEGLKTRRIITWGVLVRKTKVGLAE